MDGSNRCPWGPSRAADEIVCSRRGGTLAEYHPDKDALESCARGEILAAAERWIVDHIRSGCAICQRTVDALLPRLEGTVAAPIQPPPFRTPWKPLPVEHPPPLRCIPNGEQFRSPFNNGDAWNRIRAKLEQRLSLLESERAGAP